jgi:ketosteroid isomerase-like protein
LEERHVTQSASVADAVAAYYAAVRAGDIDKTAALFAADAVMRDPVGAPPATDDASRRQRYAGIAAAFESFAIDEQQIIVGGDEAAARWAAHGKTKTGADVRFEGISTFVFNAQRKITMMSAYFDITSGVAAMSPQRE